MKKIISAIFLSLFAVATISPKATLVTYTSKNLFSAIEQKNCKAVQKILQTRTVNINQLNENKQTALDVAIHIGNKNIIKELAGKGGRVTTEKNANYLKDLFKTRALNFFLFGLLFTPLLWIGSITSLNKSSQYYLL